MRYTIRYLLIFLLCLWVFASCNRGKTVLVVSGWQEINIGDVAQTPGLVQVLKERLPGVDVIVWLSDGSAAESELIRRGFPDVRVVMGPVDPDGTVHSKDVLSAIRQSDLLVHGSAPSLLGIRQIKAWRKLTHKPYGIFATTFDSVTPEEVQLLEDAAFVFTRETASLDTLRSKGIRNDNMTYVPDATFSMSLSDEPGATEFMREHALEDRRFICVVPRLRRTPYASYSEETMREIDAYNERYKDSDHAVLREAIIRWVHDTGNKVVVCPEMTYQVDLMDELIVNPLPEDVRPFVIKHPYWFPDEALSLYSHAFCVVSLECHSPILSMRGGTPALYIRQREEFIKGQMYYDLGYNDWIFEMDESAADRLVARMVSLYRNQADVASYLQAGLNEASERMDLACDVIRDILVAPSAPSSFGTDWYVSPSGSDSSDGRSPRTAFRTMQRAADIVMPGDRVLLCSGEYTMEGRADDRALVTILRSGRENAWITWMPAPGAKPVIRPSGWAAFDIRGSFHVLENLEIVGFNDQLTLKHAIADASAQKASGRYNTNGITIEGRRNAPDAKPHHIIIRGCSISKCAGGGIAALETDYLTVEDCRVFDNCWYMRYAGSGITTLNNWAHDDNPGYHIIIRRNLVWNNRTLVKWDRTGSLSDGNGILLDVTNRRGPVMNNPDGDATVNPTPATSARKGERPEWNNRALIENNVSAYNGGSGIHVFRTCHVDILNNTTYWNGSVVDYEELFSNASYDIVMMNNVIIPRPGGRVTSNHNNRDIVWDYNIYPDAQSVLKGEHDIVADPMPRNPGTDLSRADFRLSRKSPAVDSGTSEKMPGEDLNGRRRPRGAGVDRGAYELF